MPDDTAYIVFDVESVADGALLARTLYAGEGLTPEQALARAHEDALRASDGRSDFVHLTFQVPIAIGVARVGPDFRIRKLAALDRPAYRPERMVELFWKGLAAYPDARLVDFNGRTFDLPLLEIAAFRFGISVRNYFAGERYGYRYRYSDKHIDLLEWFTSYGAYRMKGGLNLLAKLLGNPGKLDMRGEDVEGLWRDGKLEEVGDYCLMDVLDTYFVFLRTRVLTGEISLADERQIVAECRADLERRAKAEPFLRTYLDAWKEWDPTPFQ